MTKQEIKRVEPGTLKEETKDELMYEGKFTDINVSIKYKFKDNKLITGAYTLPGMIRLHPDAAMDISGLSSRPAPFEDYYNVRTYLTKKYGKPITERRWEETQRQSKHEKSANYWLVDRSLIIQTFSVVDKGMLVAHVLVYLPAEDGEVTLRKLKTLPDVLPTH